MLIKTDKCRKDHCKENKTVKEDDADMINKANEENRKL